MMVAKGAWEWGLRRMMTDYDHWARFGLPVAKVIFSLKDNDKQLIELGAKKTIEVMWAAGADAVVQKPLYAYPIGAGHV
jgi:hypothetical protein